MLGRTAVLAVLVIAFVTLTARITAGSVLELAHAVKSPGTARDWTLDHLVGDLAAALLLVAATGLAAMSALALTAAVTVKRAPTLAAACSGLSPRMCRRLVAAALGLGLSAPVMMDGHALAVDPGPATGCRVECRHGQGQGALGGLGFPDLPSASTAGLRPGPRFRQVVVHAGDSLWRIAERRLSPGSSTGDVASLTWRLYALNRSTVGDDPDLIYPGMTLIAPEGSS